jgi:glycosyltransferase involved in cell wall biosynthesis
MAGPLVATAKQPVVSIVVPTRNSGGTLEATLSSARRQGYGAVEVLVVDNGSVDETLEIARSLADVVLSRGPERSAQRNFGAAHASGSFLLMLDSDMILEEGVVQACLEAHRSTGAAATVIPERTIGYGFWTSVRAFERSFYVGDPDIEAARFFTRSAFERYEGYDEALSAGEDWDLPARMRASGEIVSRASGVWILHDERRVRLGAHLRKKYYYGQTLVDYAARHPALARRQLRLVRPAFVRAPRRLVRHPLLAAAMFFMKASEMAAGATGAAVGTWRRRRASADGESGQASPRSHR